MLFEIHYAIYRIQTALQDQAVLEVADKVASKSVVAAGAVSVVGGLTANEWGIWIGSVCVIINTVAAIYFKWKRYRLDEKQVNGGAASEKEDS